MYLIQLSVPIFIGSAVEITNIKMSPSVDGILKICVGHTRAISICITL
jgi:hypothetical protein